MHKKIAQTGIDTPATIGTRTESRTTSDWLVQRSLCVECIGTLRAAENGLVIVRAANCSVVTEEIPWKYRSRPTGTTKRNSRVRYVITIAVAVRRTSAEHMSPT